MPAAGMLSLLFLFLFSHSHTCTAQLGLRPSDLLSAPRSLLSNAGIRLSSTLDALYTAASAASTLAAAPISTTAPHALSPYLGVDTVMPSPRQHRTVSVEDVLRSSAKRIGGGGSNSVTVTSDASVRVTETEAERELLRLRKRLYGLREKVRKALFISVVSLSFNTCV